MTLSFVQAADKKPAPLPPTPPVAKVVPKTITMLGDERTDNYFWLREKSNPEVIQYLEAENKYTEGMLKPVAKLQETIYKEILGRIKQTDLSVPSRQGEYYYYSRTEEGKQYPIQCRKKGSLTAPEEVLLDQNELAKGQKYFRVGGFRVSPNHKLLAYSTDVTGDETYTLHVKDLETGALLPDTIRDTYYGLVWANDNKTVIYTRFDAARRPDRAYRHVLGDKPEDDTLLYQEKDDKFNLSIGKMRSQQYIIIDVSSFTSSEIRFLNANEPAKTLQMIEPRQKDVEYSVEHHGDSFYIRVNDTGRNFRLVKAPVSNPSRDHWHELMALRNDVTLESVNAFRNYLVIGEREKGLQRLRVQKVATGQACYIVMPEPVYAVFPGDNPEFDTDVFRFNYTSMITPSSIFDYNMEAQTSELKKQTEVLGGYDPRKYETVRVYAAAPDGVEVPVSLVYRKGLVRNGKNPTMLYGYGSYGSSTDPTFSSARLSLIDRGWVYAIAHIRGGSDLGEKWHDEGKLLKKNNTFTDFIAAAEKLVKDKYTEPDKLAMMGGSAGGMLMGAVVNMRPDLFKAVIAAVPFVDVLNTATDPTLPLTTQEYEEWGDSNQKQYYDYIKSYSPYDNVAKKAYPNMLITAGLNDPRVSYWEPAKWTAKLRAMKTGNNLLLLKTNMGAGHFGASGRYEQIKETALQYAFLLHVMGME